MRDTHPHAMPVMALCTQTKGLCNGLCGSLDRSNIDDFEQLAWQDAWPSVTLLVYLISLQTDAVLTAQASLDTACYQGDLQICMLHINEYSQGADWAAWLAKP